MKVPVATASFIFAERHDSAKNSCSPFAGRTHFLYRGVAAQDNNVLLGVRVEFEMLFARTAWKVIARLLHPSKGTVPKLYPFSTIFYVSLQCEVQCRPAAGPASLAGTGIPTEGRWCQRGGLDSKCKITGLCDKCQQLS